MKYIKNKLLFPLIILVCFALLYFISTPTYTRYESETAGNMNLNIAKWFVTINGHDINTLDKKITLSDIAWNSTHTIEGKVSPGTTGNYDLVISGNDTQVSLRYDIVFEDRTSNEDIALTVSSITSDDALLVRTGKTTYTGLLDLSDIADSKTHTIHLAIAWVNDEDMNDRDSKIGNNLDTDDLLLDLKVIASQYKGEVLTPYTESDGD